MRTTQRLTMTGILACTALVAGVAGVAFVAWPDERPTAAVADGGVQEGIFPSPTASASSSPARSKRAGTPAVRTVHAKANHSPGNIPTVQQSRGRVPSGTSPSHAKQGSPKQPPPPQPLPGPRLESVTSPDDCDVAISSDRHAVTVAFCAFELKVSSEKAGTRHATKTVPVDLRMAKGTLQGRVRVVVQGYAFTQNARGSLTISGGDRQASQVFEDGWDNSYLQSLDLAAAPGATVRVSITVDVRLHANSKDGFGDMSVSSLDAAIV